LPQINKAKYIAVAGALSALLYCSCGSLGNKPLVEEPRHSAQRTNLQKFGLFGNYQISDTIKNKIQNIQKKEIVVEKKEEKSKVAITDDNILEDSWSGGKCVMKDGILRITKNNRIAYLQLPKDIEWKYIFCSEKRTMLVANDCVFHGGGPENFYEMGVTDAPIIIWRIMTLNSYNPEVDKEPSLGKLKYATLDKEHDTFIAVGEKGAKVATLDRYPYSVYVMFEGEPVKPDARIFFEVKQGYFVLGREGDKRYAIGSTKTGKFIWSGTGEQIEFLKLISSYADIPRVRVNDKVMEYYWEP